MMALIPWYERADALSLLANCALMPPFIEHRHQQFVVSRDEWSVYNPDDARVRRLEQIRAAELAPVMARPDAFSREDRASALTTVEAAIDAVRTDGVRATEIWVELPAIDLAERRVAA